MTNSTGWNRLGSEQLSMLARNFEASATSGDATTVPRRTRRSLDGVNASLLPVRPSDLIVEQYDSLLHLRHKWQRFDAAPSTALTAVLALDPYFGGDLRSIVRRRYLAARLVLTTPADIFPSMPDWSFTAASAALGWRQIVVHRDWKLAVQQAVHQRIGRDRVVLFWPSWHAL